MANVVIRVDGVDITTDVLYDGASFESQMGALPGTFEFTIKDSLQVYSFTTGAEVTLDVDGTRLYGGYLTSFTEKFAFPVDLTAVPANVKTRQYVLRGVDYNVLFDKRVLRKTSDYEHHLALFPAGSAIGALVRDPLCSTYLDIPAGFDTTSQVTATTTGNPDEQGSFMEQGTTWRKQMEDFARWGVVYYLTAAKQLYVKEVEDSLAKWQFSDKPNRYPIPSGYSYLPTVGFREGEFTEDGTLIVNDALVWGGSEWSNGIVFARRTNDASIAARGRWQIAETHFGEYKKQARVTARANVIVDGTVSGTSGALTRGFVNPQRMAKVTWFAHGVPTDPNAGGARAHLRPGDITTFILYTLGTDAAHPLILDLPLRSVVITFPGLDPLGNGYVQFEGTFGLQLSDPWWLWKYLRDRRDDVAQLIVATTTDTSGGGGGGGNPPVQYGTTGGFTPLPSPDGSTTVFNLPNGYGYVNGTTEVYVNGLRYFSPANYTESDPTTGEITFLVAPSSTDVLYVVARLTGASTSTEPPPTTGYFIAPTGNDSTGDGSLDHPWATLSKFFAKPPIAGDTLYCRGGTFSGSGNRNISLSTLPGTAGNPITVKSYPGEFALFDGGANGSTDDDRFFVIGTGPVNGLIFSGITLRNYAMIQDGIFTISNQDVGGSVGNWIFEYCDIQQVAPADPSAQFIYLGERAHDITVRYCIFRGPYPSGLVTGGAGVSAFSDDGPSPTNVIVDHCIFINCFTGAQFFSSGVTGQITHNTFINCRDNIDATHHSTILVRNNAGTNGADANFYDPDPTGTTADHNFWAQTFDSNFYLLPGNTGKGAATDGTDAGALDN